MSIVLGIGKSVMGRVKVALQELHRSASDMIADQVRVDVSNKFARGESFTDFITKMESVTEFGGSVRYRRVRTMLRPADDAGMPVAAGKFAVSGRAKRRAYAG